MRQRRGEGGGSKAEVLHPLTGASDSPTLQLPSLEQLSSLRPIRTRKTPAAEGNVTAAVEQRILSG